MTQALKTLSALVALISLAFISPAQEKPQYLFQVGIVDSLYSSTLEESREIFIYLPSSYASNENESYPVAYIIDGELLLPTVADCQNYYSGGYSPEMILVGISNRRNRTRDLTPSKIETKYGMPFQEESGGAEKFMQFIEKELIPYIESEYRVNNYRSLIGHSYGGLFSIYTLLQRPALFANYLAIDPSLDWDDQKIVQEAQTLFAQGNWENKSLFISLSGQLHLQDSRVTIDNVMQDSSDYTLFARANVGLSNFLKNQGPEGLRFHWQFYPQDLHGTVVFPSIREGLINTFAWYQWENTAAINSFDSSPAELLEIIKYREQKLKKHFGFFVPPYPEDLLNMLAYMNMDMQRPAVAKVCFELGIEYYPKSANVYDSMADYYEAQGEMELALKFVKQAFAISPQEYYQERMAKLEGRK